jgi:hypothetical protein
MAKIDDLKSEWVVFGVGKNSPSVTHLAKSIAIEEAERLSRLSPGVKFMVCKIFCVVETVVIQETTCKDVRLD